MMSARAGLHRRLSRWLEGCHWSFAREPRPVSTMAGVSSSWTAPAPLHQRQQQPSCTRFLATSRRRRPRFSGHREVLHPSASPVSDGGLVEAYQHGEESMEEYLKKASLSPWVPLPDAACRKLFDLAKAEPSDIHVDLGAGDGRINFHAIDYGVGTSIGIDVDENILKLARERMAKRHPPPNMEFIVADLLDETNTVWEKVQECTILSMHLADTALEKLRPILERKLAGRELQILTAGYEMPGWESTSYEVVLGTQIHLYRWGMKEEDGDGTYGGFSILGEDDMLKNNKPKGMLRNALESKKFEGSKIIDRTTGRNPFIRSNDSDDEEDDDGLTSDEEDEHDDDDQDMPKPTRKKQSRGCHSKQK